MFTSKNRIFCCSEIFATIFHSLSTVMSINRQTSINIVELMSKNVQMNQCFKDMFDSSMKYW